MSEADGVFVVCFILFSPVPSLTRLYAHISLHARIYAITTEDALAGKLTGMLLETSTTEILLEEDMVASASSASKSRIVRCSRTRRDHSVIQRSVGTI